MDVETAVRLLGLQETFTAAEVEAAKRRLLQAFHPDKHPTSQADVFQRMTQDVLEAAEVLSTATGSHSRRSTKRPTGNTIERILFADVPGDWKRAKAKAKGVVRYDKTFVADDVLAVAIHGIQRNFVWCRSAFGQTDEHVGSALYMTVLNRLGRRIDSFYVGMYSLLIDDRGHQYSPTELNFYWTDRDGSWHSHTHTLAPRAKLEGFVLFPPLRKNSRGFRRWYFASQFSIGDDYHDGEYDIELSRT